MAYETSAAVFALLNVESITAVSNGVSPFVRNRSVAFPAVVFDINSEEFENTATEVVYRTANVDVQCLAKSQETADAMVDAVISRCSHFSGTLAESVRLFHCLRASLGTTRMQRIHPQTESIYPQSHSVCESSRGKEWHTNSTAQS